jgi:hypothetical protein
MEPGESRVVGDRLRPIGRLDHLVSDRKSRSADQHRKRDRRPRQPAPPLLLSHSGHPVLQAGVPRKLVLGWHSRVQRLPRCDAPPAPGNQEVRVVGQRQTGLPVPIFGFRQKTTQMQDFTVLTRVIPCGKVNWATLCGDQFR